MFPYLVQKQVVHFRRWTRKSYAVFRSIGKLIRIGVLLYTMSLLRESCSAQQTDSLMIVRSFPDDEVVITAQRLPVLASQASRPLEIMAPELYRHLALTTVAEALDLLPGVDIRQRGAPGIQADLSLRGGSFDQTLVLLNGINLTNPQTGHHSFDIPLSPCWISRIEVLRGPAARIWGPNAFAGAINLLTPYPSQNHSQLSIQGGQHHLISLNGSIMRHHKKWGWFAGLSHQNHKGFAPNTDASQQMGFGKLIYQGRTADYELQTGISHKAFGANSFYSPKYPDQYEETFSGFLSAGANIFKEGFTLTPKTYLRRHYDRFELFRNQAPAWYKNHNYHTTLTAGVQLPASIQWKGGTTALGLEWRREEIQSNLLGKLLNQPVKVLFSDSTFYTRSAERQQFNIYSSHFIAWRKWSFSTGAMLSWLSSLHRWEIYPGADISYALSYTSSLYFSVNRTLRLPTFTDLYYKGPINLPNPELKPETAVSIETGWTYRSDLFTGSMDFFQRKGQNLIDWIKLPGEEKWRSVNHTRIDVSGGEFSVVIEKKILKKFFPKIQALRLSYSLLHASKAADSVISRYVLDPLRHKATINILIRPITNIRIGIDAIYQFREGFYSMYDETGNETPMPYGGTFVNNIKVTYTLGIMELFFSAQNLTNTRYYDHGAVPLPGLWINFGLVLKQD